jgi:hypothetical protein
LKYFFTYTGTSSPMHVAGVKLRVTQAYRNAECAAQHGATRKKEEARQRPRCKALRA